MSLLPTILLWLFAPRQMLGLLLCVTLTLSGLGVGYSAHMTRTLYRDLQVLEKGHDDLEHEYEKLLIEQSTLASYVRLDQLVKEKLVMVIPTPQDTVMLK